MNRSANSTQINYCYSGERRIVRFLLGVEPRQLLPWNLTDLLCFVSLGDGCVGDGHEPPSSSSPSLLWVVRTTQPATVYLPSHPARIIAACRARSHCSFRTTRAWWGTLERKESINVVKKQCLLCLYHALSYNLLMIQLGRDNTGRWWYVGKRQDFFLRRSKT